jgi:F-type H+-transporting ATPase subunit delta
MIPAAITQRWAKALVELASTADALEVVNRDINALAEAVAASSDLKQLIRNPRFSPAMRRSVFEAMIERMGVNDLIRPFVLLLIEKDRIAALQPIARAVSGLTDDALGRTRATVVSAVALSDDDVAKMTQALEARVGKKVVLSTSVDASLIGGSRVQIGSQRLDGSVAARLERLKRGLGITA